MQTFLPYPDFDKSAQAIDSKRLGNQAYREGLTLINGGWKNHPASKMWKGYEYALAEYCLACLRELTKRGRHYQKWYDFFESKKKEFDNTGLPPWIGNKEFHDSHKSNLIRKFPEHYQPMWPELDGSLPYIWPTNSKTDSIIKR